MPAGLDEGRLQSDSTPEQWATRLAREKALRVAERAPGTVVLGADTVVAVDGEALGKPADEAEARSVLRHLRGRWHDVITGVALEGELGIGSGHVRTRVLFRRYADQEIEEYIATGSPMDKAGSYGIQDTTFSPVERIAGCYLNVVGLPVCLLAELFRDADVEVKLDCERCGQNGMAEPETSVAGCREGTL